MLQVEVRVTRGWSARARDVFASPRGQFHRVGKQAILEKHSQRRAFCLERPGAFALCYALHQVEGGQLVGLLIDARQCAHVVLIPAPVNEAHDNLLVVLARLKSMDLAVAKGEERFPTCASLRLGISAFLADRHQAVRRWTAAYLAPGRLPVCMSF